MTTDATDARDAADATSARLFLLRHGQSAGNIAADAARRDAANRLTLDTRDMDVDLSRLGEQQARATADWVRRANVGSDHVFASPYRRAARTAQIAFNGKPLRRDERLREREFGILDRLTARGIEAEYPEQAAARAFLGKFYHRPPGGESWADVGLRVRSFLADLERDTSIGDDDIVVVTHQTVIMMIRYVLEELDEATLLEIDQSQQMPNCAVTTYSRAEHGWSLAGFASIDHLEPQSVTRAGDYTGAPR